jgi:two-component system, response regulator
MVDKVILLVEDEPHDEALIVRVLRKNNIVNQIVVAHDGVEALEYLFATGPFAGRDPAEIPEVILLDIKLPRIDGFEVLRRVREDPRTRLVPIVLLTSSDEERDRAAGYALGANSYVRKPVEFDAFTDAIRQLGLYWLILNCSPGPRGSMSGA